MCVEELDQLHSRRAGHISAGRDQTIQEVLAWHFSSVNKMGLYIPNGRLGPCRKRMALICVKSEIKVFEIGGCHDGERSYRFSNTCQA